MSTLWLALLLVAAARAELSAKESSSMMAAAISPTSGVEGNEAAQPTPTSTSTTTPTARPAMIGSSCNDSRNITILWWRDSDAVGRVDNVVINIARNFVMTSSSALDADIAKVTVLELETGTVEWQRSSQYQYSNYYSYNMHCSNDGRYLGLASFSNNSQVAESTISLWRGVDSLDDRPLWTHKFNGMVYKGTQGMKVVSHPVYRIKYLAFGYMDTLGDSTQRTAMPGGTRWLSLDDGRVIGDSRFQSTLGELWIGDYARLIDREFDGRKNMFNQRSMPSGEIVSELLLKNRTAVRVGGVGASEVLYISEVAPRTISAYSLDDKKFLLNINVSAKEEWLGLGLSRVHYVGVSWDSSNRTNSGYRVRLFYNQERQVGDRFIPVPSKGLRDPVVATSTFGPNMDYLVGIPGRGIFYFSFYSDPYYPASPAQLVYAYDDPCGFSSIEAARSARGLVAVAVLNKREGLRACRLQIATFAFTI